MVTNFSFSFVGLVKEAGYAQSKRLGASSQHLIEGHIMKPRTQMKHKTLFKMKHAASALAIALAMAAPVYAEGADAKSFDIDAQPLSEALVEFSRQSDVNVIAPSSLTRGLVSSRVSGGLAPQDALRQLLGDANLELKALPDGSIVLAEQEAEVEEAPAPFRVAEVAKEENTAPIEAESYGEERNLDVVVVTGTNIKGVKDQFSPVTSIGRDNIDLSGFRNAGDFLDRLPQNFGGGRTPDGTGVSSSGAGASSANLRGLGNEATLILLNGKRLAPGGAFADFVDISAIPTSAIERVEVVTDGASAIYGSDAIAGVVNIILRDDFEGAETRLGIGTVTEGGGSSIKVGQTVGVSGDRAHGLLTYEYSSEGALDAQSKEFASDALQPTDLLPFTQNNSLFASGGYEPTESVSISMNSFYNNRKAKQFASSNFFNLIQQFQLVEVEQYGGSLDANVDLNDDYYASVSGAYSRSEQSGDTVLLSGSNPGDGDLDTAVSEIFSVDATFGGSIFNITDDPVRAVAGGHFRHERADVQTSSRLTPDSPFTSLENARDVFAVFGEFYAPVVTETDNIPGVRRLAFTAAARYEDYSDLGSSIDPKFGAVWSPLDGLNIRGTYGSSFRAAPLTDLVDETFLILGLFDDPDAPGGVSPALNVLGTTSQLAPEQSTAWTVGFDYQPKFVDGLSIRATYFDIDYEDRVAQPSLAFSPSFAFTNFDLSPVRVTTPSPLVQALVDEAVFLTRLADFFPGFGFPTDTADVTVILDQRPQNTLTSVASGLDVEARFDHVSNVGDFSFALAMTRLTKFEQQFSEATPVVELLNTFGNPVDFKLRGNVQWSDGPIAANIFVNHTDDYKDDEVVGAPAKIESWTTVDASFRVDLSSIAGTGIFNDTVLTFSAQNLFDEDPPFLSDSPSRFAVANYDAANADPAGRRVSFQITKRW